MPAHPREEAASATDAAEASRVLLRAVDVAIAYDGASHPVPAAAALDVAAGEVVLLLGPSGSGKSTLTLALNGLIPQAIPAVVTGRVEVAGKDVSATPVAQLSTHVGMVFQDPDAQLVTGTVLDEVAFGPENLRLPAEEVLSRTEAALRQVGLWERRRENPDRLSGGGRQRLAIACALALGSALLVLDEPTANLDPRGIAEVYAALAAVVAGGERGIVLVEHNLDAAIGLVDRVVVLDADGRVFAEGRADVVLRDRADELHALGVWLPVSTLAALRLRRAGYAVDPLPLTPEELTAALEGSPPPRIPASAEARRIGRDADAAPREVLASAETPPAGAAPLIRVRGLSVRRSRTEVLHGVDLDIAAGEFVAIVGANGAGKTTLLQALAGVIRPPKGTVWIGGLDVGRADIRTLSRRVGYVFQNPEHQFIASTVFDEVAHGLRLQGIAEGEVRARVGEVLDRFGLREKADTHPFLLSGGQKRRLSVGTTLVTGAAVLALDEPTFGQDRARADELLTLLGDLHRAGTTVIVVSHNMQLVAEYADRVVVVDRGRIRAAGPTAEILIDVALLESTGLARPPLARALGAVTAHPELNRMTRLADLPGGEP
jgi:energy-coupling factor transport system ATP-binding protein